MSRSEFDDQIECIVRNELAEKKQRGFQNNGAGMIK